jgi:hypothetical protein
VPHQAMTVELPRHETHPVVDRRTIRQLPARKQLGAPILREHLRRQRRRVLARHVASVGIHRAGAGEEVGADLVVEARPADAPRTCEPQTLVTLSLSKGLRQAWCLAISVYREARLVTRAPRQARGDGVRRRRA